MKVDWQWSDSECSGYLKIEHQGDESYIPSAGAGINQFDALMYCRIYAVEAFRRNLDAELSKLLVKKEE